MSFTEDWFFSPSYSRTPFAWIFIEAGSVIEEGDQIGVQYFGDGELDEITYDGSSSYVTEVLVKNGQKVKSNSNGLVALFKIMPLANATDDGLVDLTNTAHFEREISAPLDGKYILDGDLDRGNIDLYKADGGPWTVIDLYGCKCVEVDKRLGEDEIFLKQGTKLATVVNEKRFAKLKSSQKYQKDLLKTEDRLKELKQQEKSLATMLDKAHQKAKQKSQEIEGRANSILDDAKQAIDDANKKYQVANLEAQRIVENARTEGEEKAAMIVSRVEQEAEDKKSAILESARLQRREAAELKTEATELKSNAEVAAKQTVEAATIEAQEIISNAQADAKTERQAITDNAAMMNLEAIVTRLFEMQDKGALPGLMERPVMRRLYISLGEMLTQAQGFAAPETAAQMINLNRMDEIKAMNYALAKQIRDAEADDFLPDVVRDRMIEQLLDMTEAKGGAIVKKAVDDG